MKGAATGRPALLAGLMFIEGATSGWTAREVLDWFRTHALVLGFTAPPTSVRDGVVGSVVLVPSASMVGDKVARVDELPKLLAMSRWRVVVTMRGLLARPSDDRFLHAAIHADRVRRDRGAWTARPRPTDMLSDIVLSLFAVDVLTHRTFHEENLCVCDVCGRISYDPEATTRSGCSEHLPRTECTSGWEKRRTRPSRPPVDDGGLTPDAELRSASGSAPQTLGDDGGLTPDAELRSASGSAPQTLGDDGELTPDAELRSASGSAPQTLGDDGDTAAEGRITPRR